MTKANIPKVGSTSDLLDLLDEKLNLINNLIFNEFNEQPESWVTKSDLGYQLHLINEKLDTLLEVNAKK